jgi:hypothetical protein
MLQTSFADMQFCMVKIRTTIGGLRVVSDILLNGVS